MPTTPAAPTPPPISPTPHASQPVLDFWFGDGLALGWPSSSRASLWFGGGPALDAEITTRFGPWVLQAVAGGLTDWEAEPQQRLALILLLDQFTRNVFRGQARAFDGDPRARALVRRTLQLNQDSTLPTVARVFLYMPLMHAENLDLQDECVRLMRQLQKDAPAALQATLQGHVDAAIEHRDIVARFGRFPHRNAVLGRAHTPEEAAFLENGPRFGQ